MKLFGHVEVRTGGRCAEGEKHNLNPAQIIDVSLPKEVDATHFWITTTEKDGNGNRHYTVRYPRFEQFQEDMEQAIRERAGMDQEKIHPRVRGAVSSAVSSR